METEVLARGEAFPPERRKTIILGQQVVRALSPAGKVAVAVATATQKTTGVKPVSEPFDVVHVGTYGMPEAWFVNKLDLPVAVLQAAGYTATQVVPQTRKASDLAPYFAAYPPRLALLRGLLHTPEAVRELALQFPTTQWVSQVQSSQPYLLRHPLGHAKQAEHIALAKELPNVWYATADDTPLLGLCGCERAVHVPNVFEAAPDPTRKPRRKPKGRPAVVSVVCALRDMKNWPNALIACALAAKTHDLTGALRTARLAARSAAVAVARGLLARDRRAGGRVPPSHVHRVLLLRSAGAHVPRHPGCRQSGGGVPAEGAAGEPGRRP